MNKYYGLVVLLFIGVTIAYEKWVKEKTLRKLYNLKMQKDDEGFINMIESPYVKFLYSVFTREFMKLNYFIDTNNKEKIEDFLPIFEDLKLKNSDLVSLYSKMFGYYLQEKKYNRAEKFGNQLIALLENKTDEKSKLMLGETQQIIDIYIKHDITMIDDLVEILPMIENDEARAILCFRIAKLYYYKKDKEMVEYYLKQSIKLSMNEKQKEDLIEMLSDNSKLD